MSHVLDLFAISPLKPMQKHMDTVLECVQELTCFLKFVLAEDWGQAENSQNKICLIENEADALKKELRLHLPKGLFMPVERTDLLWILSSQDNIANKAKDIAGLILGRKMKFPELVKKELSIFLQRSVDASVQAGKAIHQLDELLESGFTGKEVLITEEMVVKLDKIENDVDLLQIKVRQIIFSLEKDLPAVDVIFMYKIIEWVGDLSDLSQQVGSRLELLLAR